MSRTGWRARARRICSPTSRRRASPPSCASPKRSTGDCAPRIPRASAAAGAADEAEALVASIPAGYFAEIAALAPGKPFAIAESGWPAEPYPIAIAGSPAAQRAYVERLLREAEALDAAFVTWFFTRDLDEQWRQQLAGLPLAPTVRLWRYNGLCAGDGAPRPALDTWRETLARPLR